MEGRLDVMWSLTSLSKHFVMMGVSTMGWKWLRPNTVDFFCTGIMVVALKHEGTTVCLKEMLKLSVRTCVSLLIHSLSLRIGVLSGSAAFWLALHRVFWTSAGPKQ